MTATIALPAQRPYRFLLWLQALDVLTTTFILTWWSERAEGNPIARVFTNMGATGMILMLAFKFAIVLALYRKGTGVKIMSTIYSLVIANNLLFLILWWAQ